MKLIDSVRPSTVLAPLLGALLAVAPSWAQTVSPPAAQYPALPSDTPATFVPASESFDYVKRDVMIAMRDGVKLHTVILVPQGARRRSAVASCSPRSPWAPSPLEALCLRGGATRPVRVQLAPEPVDAPFPSRGPSRSKNTLAS